MEIINLNIKNLENFKEEIAICLGYFDGLHLGHLSLINNAKQSKYKSAILILTTSNKHKFVLLSIKDKLELLAKMNLDYAFVLEFNDEVKNLKKEAFIEILKKLNVKEIYIGRDYTFAKNKEGTIFDLKKENFFKTNVLPYVKKDNIKISSSLIFEYLSKGFIKKTNEILGRRYVVFGKIDKNNEVHLIANYFLPKDGIYNVSINILNNTFETFIKINEGKIILFDEIKEELLIKIEFIS